MQLPLFPQESKSSKESNTRIKPFSSQLLKWIGNKQKFAHEIISYFPENYGTYYEPFLGSGGVLATLAPNNAIASDSFKPLIEIFQVLQDSPEILKHWYQERWEKFMSEDRKVVYEQIIKSYTSNPNPADLLFISRSCYGGVIRFRKIDGYISTPIGIHTPISPKSFSQRVDEWHKRTMGTLFIHNEYEEAMNYANSGDLIYCDPPYSYSQSILYGAQEFSLENLFSVIAEVKKRGVYVILSIDGSKKSGNLICNIPVQEGLFEREVFVNVGRSMLKRFQMNGKTLENEVVRDRLLLTY
jgi:DNA adenine methylase